MEQVQSLARQLPYVMSVAIKKEKRKNKVLREKKKKKSHVQQNHLSNKKTKTFPDKQRHRIHCYYIGLKYYKK